MCKILVRACNPAMNPATAASIPSKRRHAAVPAAARGERRQAILRAAEKLFVTQSALSSRIAALEEELGVMLLDRSGRQFRLTAAGNRFLKSATKLLAMGVGTPYQIRFRVYPDGRVQVLSPSK